MTREMWVAVAVMAAGLLAALGGWLLQRAGRRKLAESPGEKKYKRQRTLGLLLMIGGLWLFVVKLLPLLLGTPEKDPGFSVELWPERVEWMGLSISTTVITTWIAMGVVLVMALLARIFVIPRMRDVPKGVQNVLEVMVEQISRYTNQQTEGLGTGLPAYIFSVAVLLVACAMVELFGVRAPSADITMTFALALVTFFLINFYGIKRKGVKGRIKALANPTPVVLVLRVISDCALPVSMACRLFGNMLGGMIVMDLLYKALGSAAVGLPSVIGLYFNVFHPLIQAFIFITLTLTFINEAAE